MKMENILEKRRIKAEKNENESFSIFEVKYLQSADFDCTNLICFDCKNVVFTLIYEIFPKI